MTDDTRRSMMLAAGAAMAAISFPALAQQTPPAPREGKDFRPVRPPQQTDVPAGKIEVLEFFWYGCPHCYTLEPVLKSWVARLPDDVVFRKLHVPFGDRNHQQLFCTLDAMGKAGEVNDAIFKAIHVDRNPVDNVDRMVALLGQHGIDGGQFRDTYKSFAVRTQMRRAAQIVDAYGVDGVPAMAVNGKYYTAPSMAGSNAAALVVLDHLIERERRAAK